MKPVIYFRVDGNAQIGLGHVVRCIALAQMLESDFNIEFVCNDIPESFINELDQLGFGFTRIDNENDFLSKLISGSIIVLDHYAFDSDYQKKIKEKGYKLVCIDDLHDKTFFADLIINHAPGVTPLNYQAQINTQFALGLDYVLLRPIFLNKAKQPVIRAPIETVFVCFGGADSKNLTQIVVDVLKVDERFNKIIVVTGSAYSYLNQLKSAIGDSPNVFLHHAIDSGTVAGLMEQAGLAIVPASGILLEAMAVGCKIIAGMYVENQKFLFEKYKDMQAFVNAQDFSSTNLKVALNEAFKLPVNGRKKVFDGHSGIRLLKMFYQLTGKTNLELRKARRSDLKITYKWATNKKIREFSFSKDSITFDEHRKWFLDKIESPECYYYLAENAGKIVGSIRLDIDGSDAIISYLVDTNYQGIGFGTELLKKGVMALASEKLRDVNKVTGYVMPENKASCRTFEKLGFKKTKMLEKYQYTLSLNQI